MLDDNSPDLSGDRTTAPDRPFRPEYINLLTALDRLLTVGTYYQPLHERYRAAAQDFQAALQVAVAGGNTLCLEINYQGFHIDGETAELGLGAAKRLVDLLDPLNIGRLEIDAGVEPAALHQAFTALQAAHEMRTGNPVRGARKIPGMPESVRATPSRLLERAPREKPRRDPGEFMLLATDLMAEDSLAPDPDQGEPDSPAIEDTVGIMVQLLALDPADDRLTDMKRMLGHALDQTPLAPSMLIDVARPLAGALSAGTPGQALLAMDTIWTRLQVSAPGLMGDLWGELWFFLTPAGQENAWPYLVNDLLLGLEFGDRVRMMILFDALSQVEACGKREIINTLENRPAMLAGHLDERIFEVKPPLLYPVFKVLVGSSMSATFGPLLHCRLLVDAPNRLSSVLLECVDGYQPINRGLYHAILDQGVREGAGPDLVRAAAPILEKTLADLHWDYLKEDWVVDAITWLGKVGRRQSFAVLEMILTEKRWKFMKAWPESCRQAAEQATRTLLTTLEMVGHSDEFGVYDVKEDQDGLGRQIVRHQ